MKKLTLEALEVTSFETTPAGSQTRGTAHANQIEPAPPSMFECEPTDANMDCTYGCSHDTACPNNCFGETEFDCVPA